MALEMAIEAVEAEAVREQRAKLATLPNPVRADLSVTLGVPAPK
jgi:hypothetical protein